MEKRLVLSFVLSFLVLYIWSSFIPKTDNQKDILENPQIIESKQFNGSGSSQFKKSTVQDLSSEIIRIPEEKLYSIENKNFVLNFSSSGANLLDINIKGHDTFLPITRLADINIFSNYQFNLDKKTDNKIEFIYSDENIIIKKIYEVNDSNININIILKNNSKFVKNDNFNFKCFTLNMNKLDGSEIESSKDKNSSAGDHTLYEYVLNTDGGIKRKNNAFKFSNKENSKINENIKWFAFRNRYYCAIVKPNFKSVDHTVTVLGEKELELGIVSERIELKPGESKEFSFTTYIGPERLDLLKKYGSEFEKIKRYYKFGLFDVIAKFIAEIMNMLFKIIPNWGVTIIIISIIIYYSMYPLTARGMASMKKMQAMQPKIQILKEKYSNNPQKLNQEMLELYRKEKINPLGGCFPILLQMPVFIGLYQVLWRNVDFEGAGFLWISDLSRPDRLFILNFNLPIIGNEINLLPILMMIIMYFQQKFSSKNMILTDPIQIQQQKLMATLMPLLLGFIFYKFASGLTLYFTMFYIFSTLTQWKISKEPKI